MRSANPGLTGLGWWLTVAGELLKTPFLVPEHQPFLIFLLFLPLTWVLGLQPPWVTLTFWLCEA